jgi:hypothetical protein
LLKHFILSSLSHVILLGLLLLKNGIDDRDRSETFYQKNMVVDTIPLIEVTIPQDNLDSETREVRLRETYSFKPQTDHRKVDPTFTNSQQQLKTSSSKIKFSEDNTVRENQNNNKTRTVLPTPNPYPSKKLITKKIPNRAETAFSEMTATQKVQYTRPILPKPKPRVRADFRQKNRLREETFDPDNSPTDEFPLTSQSRDKNTAALETRTSEVLSFKREPIPQIELSKKAKFSIEEMLKLKKSKNPFQSSQPKIQTGVSKPQCNLASREKTKAEINIREIQKRIRSRGITISNILTYRSQQKMNEITISSLLASKLNTPSYNQRKASDNIGFLLTTNSLQSYAEDLVCISY